MLFKTVRLLQADNGAGTGEIVAESIQSEPIAAEEQATKENVIEPTEGETTANTSSNHTVSADEFNKLKAELEKLQNVVNEKATLEAAAKKLQNEIDQLKTDKTLTDNKATEYEAVIEEIVKSKLETIPENFRELVPSNLSIKEKLNWLNKAETVGLFKGEVKEYPNVEIGKPFNPTSPKQHIDYSSMSPASMLAAAYGYNK